MRTGPMLMSLAVLLAGVAVTPGVADAQDALANCAAMGSFMLVTGNKLATRVRRVR